MVFHRITKNRLWIYPIIIFVFVIVLSLCHLHSSSVGMYRLRLFPSTAETDIIFGSPRAIRSDQYLIEVPVLISQDINNEPLLNEDMGDGTNLGINTQPTKSLFTIFRPSVWIFFLSNNIEFNFSFYWWTKFALLLISTYLLLLELTKKNLALSIFGSLLFFFTPFIQWWIPIDGITCISFGLFCFIRLIKGKSLKKEILWGMGLAYWIISFALILYPPFQIPLMYAAIFVALGIILKNRRILFPNSNKLKRIIAILFGVVLLTAILLGLYFNMFSSVIDVMTSTVYPGSRFMSAGQGSIFHLVNGFYNLLMQKDANGAPFANQSEASNFFMLYLPLTVWLLYKNILSYVKDRKLDWLGISISLSLILLTSWYLFPIPDVISKYTGMYMVLPQRVFIGIGFANYILIFYMLSKNLYKLESRKVLDWIIATALLISTALLMYLTGRYLYNSNPTSFFWPTLISPIIKILLVTGFVPTLLAIFFLGYKKIFLGLLLISGIISSVYVNPLYKGLDVLINTELADYITEVSTKDDSKWIFYNDHYFAQYALANNANVVNGIHMYPQFETWKILDPEKKYMDIYNRYAHIMISEYVEGEELVELSAMDALIVNINPCDEKLRQLGVKYVLSTNPLGGECLTLSKTFNNNKVYIYQTN